MDNTKTSIFSKIMAVISVIIAGVLLYFIYDNFYPPTDTELLGVILGIVISLFITTISLSVIFSWFPRLLSIKIIFLVIAIVSLIVPIGLIAVLFDILSWILWHTSLDELLGIIVSLIGCCASFWTILTLIRHIVPIKKKVLIIGSICFFLIAIIINVILTQQPKNVYNLSSRETSAIAGLQYLVSAETTWHEQDTDRNGIKDYWTYDVSCFNRMYRADKKTKCNFIDIAFAKADEARAKDNIFGPGVIVSWDNTVSPTAKSGYCFRAMLTDEDGKPYNQNEVGEKKIKATNSSKFAFVAYPALYGTTGVRTFIINESGRIYGADCGSDANKIILQWPGKDPTKVKCLIGTIEKYWQIAE